MNLRDVYIGETNFRLTTWDTGKQGYFVGSFGKHVLGYRLTDPNGNILFEGEDFGCSPCHAIDSDDALRSILGFLTLRPGDTDSDYFKEYNQAQLDFCDSDAEYLSLWSSVDDPEFTKDYPFIEIHFRME